MRRPPVRLLIRIRFVKQCGIDRRDAGLQVDLKSSTIELFQMPGGIHFKKGRAPWTPHIKELQEINKFAIKTIGFKDVPNPIVLVTCPATASSNSGSHAGAVDHGTGKCYSQAWGLSVARNTHSPFGVNCAIPELD